MKNKHEESVESSILVKLKEIENKFGKIIPLDLLKKEIDSSISLGHLQEIINSLVRKGVVYIPRENYVKFFQEPIITKDLIEAELCDCLIRHMGMGMQQSRVFCDKIEYLHEKTPESFNHHLFFWNHGFLVFKIWLPNSQKDKEFKNIFKALESCGIKCLVRDGERRANGKGK